MTTSDIHLPAWVTIPVYIGVCFAAVWKGEWAERIVGVAKPATWIISIFLLGKDFSKVQWGPFGADVILFFIMVWVALRSDKYWPLWAAGFQLLAILSHVARMADPKVGAWAYATVGVIFTHLNTAALGVGTWGCIRRSQAAKRATSVSSG